MTNFQLLLPVAIFRALIGVGMVMVCGCGDSEKPSQQPAAANDAVDSVPSMPLSYNRDVRPILSDKCFACHGPDRGAREADLRLDVAENGKDYDGAHAYAAVPGDVEKSELVELIHSDEPKTMMPPAKVKNPLSEEERAILVRWIEEGAKYEPHWAFLPIEKPEVPVVQGDTWSRNAIDRFVFAKLAQEGIRPSPEADKVVWLRRVTQDLTGLPPTPEAVDAFVADPSADAYEKVVDALLKTDDYAERMATVWLDNARYADSNGFQFDNRREMWPWRDWVIKAFRDNMPFDQFVTEQLAGDLLPNATEDQKIATGFNRNHPTTIEGGVIEEEYRVTNVNDRTTTMGTLFMGLTLECARCHDHKYDPISIDEYYQLYAFFNTSADPGKGDMHKPIPPFIQRDKGQVMIMEEKERKSFVLEGGQFDRIGKEVQSDTPEVLPPFGERPRNRLGLAQWLLAEENPLMARVTVNRLWQQFFGIGLFKQPDNLGLQSEVPSHPELLDYLAADFRQQGWDLHLFIKQVVLSATYRQNSTHRPELEDPDNRLLARGPSFRLPAEMIRDQALFASGLLSQKIGGPPVFPYQPEGIWEDLNAPSSHAERYEPSKGEDLYRKSLYTYWRRAATHPAMQIFDAPSRDVCSVKRETTNTPLQALAVLHGPTYVEASRKLAERVVRGQTESTAQIAQLMRLVLSREHDGAEFDLLEQLFKDRLAVYRNDAEAAENLLAVGESPVDASLDVAQVAALADVALAVFNLSETLTRK